MTYTNKYGISASMAVFLATDEYDHNNDPKKISATSLLKSPRQLILTMRATLVNKGDIMSLLPSRMGTAIHTAVENSWKYNYKNALQDLGYSKKDIQRIKLNPDPSKVTPEDIPIYMEQRQEKTIGNYIITGKYDFIMNGQLEDIKTTGVYTYIKNTMIDKYKEQGSIYRWLNPDIITNDTMLIQYLFWNWEAFKVTSDPKKRYPPSRLLAHQIKLMTIKETEQFILDKLTLLDSLKNTPEPELPLCTSEELWRTETKYAYYKNPKKLARSTSNFDNFYEAHDRLLKDGSVGIIQERLGAVKACAFCEVRDMCTQKNSYIADGTLIL